MPEKKWIEIRAKGPTDTGDEATALLIEAGSQGVIEEVPFEPLPFDVVTPFVKDNTKKAKTLTLIGYIRAENHRVGFGLGEKLARAGWSFKASSFKDQTWTEKWKRFLKPVRVGGFLVRPVWSKAAPKKGEHLIEIFPAMAFGTGGHETTRLCLRAISRVVKKEIRPRSATMLDVGTGSGVLAIAGARLGFSRIVGTDIDAVALKNARKNCRLNKVQVRLTIKPLSEISAGFDLVVANIRTVILLDLIDGIVKKVKAKGRLILSGILAEEAELVSGRFEACGLRAVKTIKAKEWVAITFEKE